ncbi:hypothetical protein [Actinacidiphila sp. ITFR-21]|uniref:hypothetical protein n=1 Tax=Actinacidiphila sp. ITFR-21 TaxID=3075199 RepID=UPI00288A99D9|nr:hypothetical protein [Streptomyces sp. ITFR-21]WNI19429.1 hypothetical protein RLT57_30370 [Streptomyces sp. ITFR-21]
MAHARESPTLSRSRSVPPAAAATTWATTTPAPTAAVDTQVHTVSCTASSTISIRQTTARTTATPSAYAPPRRPEKPVGKWIEPSTSRAAAAGQRSGDRRAGGTARGARGPAVLLSGAKPVGAVPRRGSGSLRAAVRGARGSARAAAAAAAPAPLPVLAAVSVSVPAAGRSAAAAPSSAAASRSTGALPPTGASRTGVCRIRAS